jgi:Zn-dependent protease/CBS domain-containing protein
MKRQTIPLARILGIPVEIDYSWFLIFVLLTWMLAVSYYPRESGDWPMVQYWIMGAVTSLLLFASVLVHEFGHSVVALRYKIPVRSITLFIFGGVAQIAAEPPSAVAEFWIAIAGPVASFGLAAIFFLLQTVFADIAPLLALTGYLAYINGTLALFNLIPGFPLDGGRVFRAFLWGITHNLRRATLIAANVGRGIAFLFIVLGVWQAIAGNIGAGLWIAFIGWFLESAASAQIRQHMTQDLLAGHCVSDAMSDSYVAVSGDTALQPLVDEHILGKGQRTFVVKEGDEVVGLLTLHQIKGVPRSEWPQTTAGQVMLPAAEMRSVRPDTELWAVFQEMDRDGVNQLPVKSDSQIVGMLTRDGIISFLRTLRELEA